MFVTHGQFLSQFNLLTKSWTLHTQFDDQIKLVSRLPTDQNLSNYKICVLLKNGKFFGGIDEGDGEGVVDWSDREPTLDLDRQIRYVVQDREKYNFLLAYTYDN